jgi:F-type H+-transporting ATPase subunit delta
VPNATWSYYAEGTNNVLMQRGDLGLLPEVTAALRQRMRQTEAQPTQVEVVTAMPLDDAQREVLEAKLAAQHGAALAYTYRVNPAILGGVIVRVGDKLIDGSVASRLAAMKQALGVKNNE